MLIDRFETSMPVTLSSTGIRKPRPPWTYRKPTGRPSGVLCLRPEKIRISLGRQMWSRFLMTNIKISSTASAPPTPISTAGGILSSMVTLPRRTVSLLSMPRHLDATLVALTQDHHLGTRGDPLLVVGLGD